MRYRTANTTQFLYEISGEEMVLEEVRELAHKVEQRLTQLVARDRESHVAQGQQKEPEASSYASVAGPVHHCSSTSS